MVICCIYPTELQMHHHLLDWSRADSDLHVGCRKTKTDRNHVCDLVNRDTFMYLSVNAMLYPNCTHLRRLAPYHQFCCYYYMLKTGFFLETQWLEYLM